MKWTWRKTAGTLIVAGLLYFLWAFLGGGDDQPPIIVSDGSIHLMADFDPNGNGRGEWEEVTAGNKMKWGYRHSGGRPTSRIEVTLLDGVSPCDNANRVYPATAVVAKFSNGESLTVNFDDSLEKYRRLQATFAGLPEGNFPAKRPDQDFWIVAGDAGTRLTSVEITNAAAKTACDLGEFGRITIRQFK
jgi:hypothetical protein